MVYDTHKSCQILGYTCWVAALSHHFIKYRPYRSLSSSTLLFIKKTNDYLLMGQLIMYSRFVPRSCCCSHEDCPVAHPRTQDLFHLYPVLPRRERFTFSVWFLSRSASQKNRTDASMSLPSWPRNLSFVREIFKEVGVRKIQSAESRNEETREGFYFVRVTYACGVTVDELQ